MRVSASILAATLFAAVSLARAEQPSATFTSSNA